MENTTHNEDNKDKNQAERLDETAFKNEEESTGKDPDKKKKFPIPIDLMDDLNKEKIDPLTESITNLGYEEKPPRKKELEQTEHLDQDDK
ncbi:hypothetical protein [Flavobacterium agrisoli]|uniref:Uncharacterized protein n=1 Tax=Flavobacterium agrisoli TaxID=2793066 RepID=A0A934PN93_9FLAO|nr:hypothetical protein [Flavobacterium agrisoli]MBK0370330.1 hypothetical protein [Flavobacterium agrisoli]